MPSHTRWLPFLGFLVAAATAFVLTPYQATIAVYIMTFAIVCVGLVVMTGIAGMVSLGQAAFVGVGAYVTAWLTTTYGVSPWFGLVASLLTAGVTALLIGSITVRMSGHYLALATLCFCISLYFLIGNTEALGLFNGITGIPGLSIAGWDLRGERNSYLVALVVLAGCMWWVRRILNSRVGRVLRSLRSGSAIAETYGANAVHYRLLAFTIAAVLAALSGWLYAHVQRFVNPTPFGIHMSIEYLFMTVIGGSAQVLGAVLGAALVVLAKQELQEVLRPIFGPTTRLEMLFFACAMLLVLWRARTGLLPLLMSLFPVPQPSRQIATAEPDQLRPREAPGTAILEATAMRRTFGGLVAVDDVSIEVRAGEVLGLLGPNGAGKSTLFNLLSGTLPRTAGNVTFMGQSLREIDPRHMCRLGLARTFQHVKLVPTMSVIENVALGATHIGKAGIVKASFCLDTAEERVLMGWAMKQLERVGLADLAFSRAGSLALGHQRLVEIARALAADPVLLLLDEPAAGLRAGEKAELANLLNTLRDEGLAILLVEHDIDLISRVADRLMVMNFGRRIACGDPTEVTEDRQVQEAYLGVDS
jgi:ABC-type branched-subunit amino acid transport system ATPase component/ABC-type branched-subunit amino acid transport system permease subunit